MTLDNALDILKEAVETANLEFEECNDGSIVITIQTAEQASRLFNAQVSMMPSQDPYPELSL